MNKIKKQKYSIDLMNVMDERQIQTKSELKRNYEEYLSETA